MLELIPAPPKDIDHYRTIIGDERVDEIRARAAAFRGARVLHLNATPFGGGVAELLNTLVGLMRSVGLDAEWRVMVGSPELWDVTKSMHNLLQGAYLIEDASSVLEPPPGRSRSRTEFRPIVATWSSTMASTWENYNAWTAEQFSGDYDFVVVHDPQPAGVLAYLLRRDPAYRATTWIWRCHIDLTRANSEIWGFLRPYLAPYDAAIFTMQEYVKPDIPIGEIALIAPAIDPLSPKNLPLDRATIAAILRRYGVDPDRPLISQVSRFDPWKDPLGVIDVYKRLRRNVPDLQLAMVGSMAADDPEGWRYFELSARHAGDDPSIHFLINAYGVGNVEVNAVQSASTVVLQKSIREGFALTVSEAMWKGRPVVATNVGGIPLQVVSGETGYLVSTTLDTVSRTGDLLADTALADKLGMAGRERVRQFFLMSRDLDDYLQLFTRLRARRTAAA
jgi:trehalose synthase